jgi:hypothetical protein
MDTSYAEDACIAQYSALPSTTPAPAMELLPEQLLAQSLPHPAARSVPGRGGLQLYSKEQWEAQKPIIRRLYNHENKPYNRVVDILGAEHNFFPTYATQFYSYLYIVQRYVSVY